MPSQKEYQPPAVTAVGYKLSGFYASCSKSHMASLNPLQISAPTSYNRSFRAPTETQHKKIIKKYIKKKILLASKLPFICYKTLFGL